MVHKPRDYSKEKVPCSVRYLRTSPSGAALLITEGLRDEEGKEICHWLPVSQIDFDEDQLEEGKVIEIAIPRWLVKDKGITE